VKFIRVFAGVAIAILGFYAAGEVLSGLTTGEIMRMAKQGNVVLYKSSEPGRYWIALGFWFIASVMLIGGGLNMIRKNYKK
jgi:hypothetical protein